MSVLATHYDSEGLVNILEVATNVPASSKVVKRLETEQEWLTKDTPDDMASTAKILQNEQFQLWMKKGWSSNAIFNVLHLDKAGDKLLSNPLVVTWNKYLSAFNWENPDKKTTLWAILKYHDYSDDSVGYLLAAARKIPGTEAITAHLRAEVLQKIPNYVFSKLRLDRAGYNLLANPLFSTWIQYFDGFITHIHRTIMSTLLGCPYYNDQSLAKMVGSAMTVSSTDIVAQCVERAWQTITSTPKAVFKSLRLYTVDERRLDNPALKSWIRYTAEYNKQNPNTKSSMIGTLVEYYSEGLLLQMIIAAKNNPNTEKIASELQRALLLYQISRHEQRKREMRSDANERAECNCYTLHRRMAEAENKAKWRGGYWNVHSTRENED
ncbi:hypothetical protein GQ600_12138 [Phytophthora cactorum]|nr:hypothetical protein GQ600_12138 [Phytophthora cactorum]